MEVSAFEVSAFEVSAFEVSAFEVSAFEVSAFEVSAFETPTRNVKTSVLPETWKRLCNQKRGNICLDRNLETFL